MGVLLLGKIKIYDIAKELGLSSKEVLEIAQKLNIEALVFSAELDGKFKSDVCDIIENNIRIINGRKLMEYMEFDIFKTKRLVNKIQITQEGKKLKDTIVPVIKESRTKLLNNISDEELNFCIKVFSKIQENLKS